MKSLENASDEEVLSIIRYLDPDLEEALTIDNPRRTVSRSKRWVVVGAAVLSIGIVLYVAALRYWPAVMRLFG